jgi:chloride channel 3/4/5
MRVEEVLEMIENTEYQGFPIVKSIQDPVIQGFITRADLEYALQKIRRTQGIDPLALIFFDEVPGGAGTRDESQLVRSIDESPTLLHTFPENNLSNTFNAAPLKYIDLHSFIDQTPLGVPPKLPVELVIDMFTKLGPRYIIVKHNGRILGIVTKKDVLKYIRMVTE